MFGNQWFKKEAPLFTGLHFGFGASSGSAAVPTPFSATGGEVAAGVTPGDGYTYHYFKSNGSLVVNSAYNVPAPGVNILVIGGGGGGGRRSGGGAGAGGVANATNAPIPTAAAGASIPITVGAGGPAPDTGTTAGTGAADSLFGTSTDPYYVIGKAGGIGGYGAGGGGGSGGGGQYNNGGGTANQPTANPGEPWITNYGNNGSAGEGPPDHNSGAGGGAGGGATPGGPGYRGTAGASQPLPAWNVPLWMPAPDPYRPAINPLAGTDFGGGGGAGSYPTNRPTNMPTSAAQGGGGIGGPHTDGSGSAGVDGLGGGGGGGAGSNPGPAGGKGGAGIVVIRYPT